MLAVPLSPPQHPASAPLTNWNSNCLSPPAVQAGHQAAQMQRQAPTCMWPPTTAVGALQAPAASLQLPATKQTATHPNHPHKVITRCQAVSEELLAAGHGSHMICPTGCEGFVRPQIHSKTRVSNLFESSIEAKKSCTHYLLSLLLPRLASAIKRKEQTSLFGVSLMRSQELHQAAQESHQDLLCLPYAKCTELTAEQQCSIVAMN